MNINTEIVDINAAIAKTLAIINEERSGEQLGLYCRWEGVNKRLLKYFRFNNVYMIAGASGHGKSYLLNMLEQDFTNKALNGNFVDSIHILAFKFEMDSVDELLRNITGELHTSYAYLLSSQYDVKTASYNKINDLEYENIGKILDKFKDKPISFVEIPTTLQEMRFIVQTFKKKYSNKKLIITIDHSLLLKKGEEFSELTMIGELAHLLIEIRKATGAMIIILNQFNSDIDRIDRKDNHALHYPQKSDIYYGGQLWWACDYVFTVYQPALANLLKYGKDKIETSYIKNEKTINLLDLGLIKARKGLVGRVSLQNELYKGEINNWSYSVFNL